MSAVQGNFVTFEDVSATVGGYDVSSILEMRLVAQANGIPAVTLLVDLASSGTGGPQVGEHVSLAEAQEGLAVCQGMVKKETLSLSLTCRVTGPAAGSQTLSLKDWLLTDVAISPVQRGGVCTVSLTFQHPVCKAHFGGAVPGLLDGIPNLSRVKGGNPLSVFVAGLRAYSQVYRQRVLLPVVAPAGSSSTAAVRAALIARLDKAIADLESTVAWTHGGLPAQAELGGSAISALRQALADYALPGGGNSVFQTLVGTIIPECSLALGGDYTASQLQLGPFEPWGDASLTVRDDDIVSLDFPASDPAPISGVRFSLAASGSGTAVSFLPISALKAGGGAVEAFYVPDSELSAPYMHGPIQQFSEPGWLLRTTGRLTGVGAGETSDTRTASKGRLRLATTVPRRSRTSFSAGVPNKVPRVMYGAALLACGKAYFETSFRKDWGFSISARLLFSATGGMICPGRVVRVLSGTGEVLSGYVTTVEHVISMDSRNATTRIICSHPRFGELPAAITSTKNALYT